MLQTFYRSLNSLKFYKYPDHFFLFNNPLGKLFVNSTKWTNVDHISCSSLENSLIVLYIQIVIAGVPGEKP